MIKYVGWGIQGLLNYVDGDNIKAKPPSFINLDRPLVAYYNRS